MVFGCIWPIIARKIMLKRRASKRFVLAESGEPSTWDTTTDNVEVVMPIGIDIKIGGGSESEDPPIKVEDPAPPIDSQLLKVNSLNTGIK